MKIWAKIGKDNKYKIPNNMSSTRCLRNENPLFLGLHNKTTSIQYFTALRKHTDNSSNICTYTLFIWILLVSYS